MITGAQMSKGFAARLKELRKRADMTQEELARVAEISASTVEKLEQGKGEPTWNTVQRLAMALEVSTEAFRDDEPTEGDTAAEPEKPAARSKGKKPKK